MKKTLNVNIGSVAFTIDEDAFYTLNGYYEDIRSRLYESERQEVMDDIESRTADLFRESLSHGSQVVSIDLVKRAIAIIGNAQTFGEKRYDRDYTGGGTAQAQPHVHHRNRFYRSATDKVFGGVCGGIAQYFQIDSTMVRLVTFFLLFFGGLSLWVYIILWILMPLEPTQINQNIYGSYGR